MGSMLRSTPGLTTIISCLRNVSARCPPHSVEMSIPFVAGGQEMCLHARLSPRLYLTPSLWGTDTTALQHLYQEHFMVQTPEAAASALQQAIKL